MRIRRRHLGATVFAVTLALSASSCVLEESEHYVIQPAPPNGIHLTLRNGTSRLLLALSELVRNGQDADGALRSFGYGVRCNSYANTWYYGDRCAFRVLRATPVEGGLVQSAANRLYWSDAIAWDEFDDFRTDAMGPVRFLPSRCAHVTIRNQGDWPIEWRDSNWTHRSGDDPKC